MVFEKAELLINDEKFTLDTFYIALYGHRSKQPWAGEMVFIQGGEKFTKKFNHDTVDGCLQMMKDYLVKFSIT